MSAKAEMVLFYKLNKQVKTEKRSVCSLRNKKRAIDIIEKIVIVYVSGLRET